MEAAVHAEPLDLLKGAVGEGAADTVRVCFSDHYGVLRGRRIAADVFAAGPATRQGFCDGALVWDIRCDIFEETDFSNYGTGYPDLYVTPELPTLRPCAWTDGEWTVLGDCLDEHGSPIPVDPRGTLRRIASIGSTDERIRVRLELQAPALGREAGTQLMDALARAAEGLGLGGAAISHDHDVEQLSFELPWMAPLATADATVLLRGAAREIARRQGAAVTAMAQISPRRMPSRMLITPEPTAPALAAGAWARAEELALLLRPLPAGAAALAPQPGVEGEGDFVAASDANPYLAIAASLAAGAESAPPAPVGGREDDPYLSAVAGLSWCEWARNWFDPLLIHDAIALAEREADVCANAGGPWSHERYWECG
jgi:glutamine synthetase